MLALSVFTILFVFSLTLYRPVWGIVALFGILPSYLLKIEILPVPTTALELSTYAAVLAFLVVFYRSPDLKKLVKEKLNWLWKEKRMFVYALLFFVAVMLLNVFVSVDTRRSAGVFKGWIFAPMLAAFLLFLTFQAKKHFYFLAAALSTMMAVLSVHGIIEYINQEWLWQSIIGYPFRIDSIFTSANSFAMLAGPIIAFAAGLLIFDKDLRKNKVLTVFLSALTAVNAVAFFLTYSYGGYLGLGIALLWLAGMYAKRAYKSGRRASALGLLAVIVISLGGAFVYTISSPKFLRDFYQLQERSSLRGRMEVWGASYQALKDDPFFGWGLGNFDKAYMVNIGEVTAEPLEEVVIHAHNLFLNFWIEAGILGLIALLVVLIYAFRLHGQTRHKFGEISFAAAAMLLTLIVHGLLDTTYYKNDIAYIFWLPVLILLYVDWHRSRAS